MNHNLLISTLARIRAILPPTYQKRGGLMLGLLLLNSVLELVGLGVLIPLFLVVLKEDAIQGNEWLKWVYETLGFSSENMFIICICLAILGVIIIKNLISLLIIRYKAVYSYSLFRYANEQLIRRVYQKGFLHIKANNSHHIIRDFYTVPFQFTQKLVLSLLTLLNELVVVSLIIGGIMWYEPQIILIIGLIVGPAFWLFYRATKHRILTLNVDINEMSPVLWDTFFDLIYGFVDVKIANSERAFFGRNKSNVRKYTSLNISKYTLENIPPKVVEIAMIVGVMIMVIYGLYMFDSRQDLLMLLGVFALAAYRILPSINRIMISLLDIRGNQFTFDVLDLIPEFREEDKVEQVSTLPFQDRITIDRLEFMYPKSHELILKQVSFEIPRGKTIGLIGRSGSGKTTLLNIMLGLLKASKGNIRIDGEILSESNIVAWRSLLGYVQQDIYLTDGTLAENVAFGFEGEEIDLDRVQLVLEQASLGEFVQTLEKGMHTRVGEKGSQLSGGQKQRVGIARALYAGAEVLFFDEATSALDNETEHEITEAINRLSGQDLTMVIIAHRHTTLKYCDNILCLENGRLKEDVKYEDLQQNYN